MELGNCPLPPQLLIVQSPRRLLDLSPLLLARKLRPMYDVGEGSLPIRSSNDMIGGQHQLMIEFEFGIDEKTRIEEEALLVVKLHWFAIEDRVGDGNNQLIKEGAVGWYGVRDFIQPR